MAYRCRAYPNEAQQQVLARTFGCVRVVWNRTLAERHAQWQTERKGISYAESDRMLTIMTRGPGRALIRHLPRGCPRRRAVARRRSERGRGRRPGAFRGPVDGREDPAPQGLGTPCASAQALSAAAVPLPEGLREPREGEGEGGPCACEG